MAIQKKAVKAKKPAVKKSFVILGSYCGDISQAKYVDFSSTHATLDAAEKEIAVLGEEMRDYDMDALFIVQIIGVAKPSGVRYEKF